jgi:PAS domain S-box-containing protein
MPHPPFDPTMLALAASTAVSATVGLWLWRSRARAEHRVRALAGEAEQLADQLFASAERLERQRQLIENEVDLVVSRDAAGRILLVNEAFARAAGRPAEALIGKVFDLDAPHEPAPDAGFGQESYAQQLKAPAGDRWIVWSVIPIRDAEGRVVERYAIGRDVTERRKAEAASEAKSRFLATVSHEVRTPLNGVLGMADLLRDTPLTAEQTTYVSAIRTSGEALLSLIDEILDFSRIEAGKAGIAEGPFDLHAMAEGVVELLAPRAQGKDLEIALDIAAVTPREVVGDGARVRQILINLAGNAVKFTEAGGVSLAVAADEKGVTFAVADTGPGIRPERLESIFEEFEQAEGGAPAGGAGLGLAISRRLAEQMGGALGATSTPGEGSVFTLRLPLRPAVGGAPNPPPDFDLAGKAALVASGGPYEGRLLAERLRDIGVDAVLTTDAPDAVAALAARAFDIAIVDCGLGLDAARDVATAALAAGVRQRLVLLSPYERRTLGSPAAAGFDGYLVKPVRVRSLHARLRPEAPAPAAAPAIVLNPEAASLPPLDVLLAEDNDINALLATKLLEKHGCAVTLVKDGDAALAALRGGPVYAAAFLDVRMPRRDGRSVAEDLRRHEALTGRPSVRLAAVTANASADDRRACLAAGFDAFIPKPLDRAAIAAFVAEVRAAHALSLLPLREKVAGEA